MPKPTFYNLPDDKRDVLVRATMAEFSRTSLQDASIANIVKDAGIARGSFYQYFENKEDAYFYLLERNLAENESLFSKALEANRGDLFSAFLELFRANLIRFQQEEERDFFRNSILNMNYKVEQAFKRNMHEQRKQEFMQMASKINIDLFRRKQPEDILRAVSIIQAVTLHNLTEAFVLELTVEEAVRRYEAELDLIKRGVYTDTEGMEEK